MVYRGLCWNRERENDPRADGPGGLADSLKGLGHAILRNFSTDQIVIELT